MSDADISQELQAEAIEEVYPGLFREWYCEKRLVVYRLATATSTIITAWSDLVINTLETWDKTQPYLALHDISQPGISLQYAMLVEFDTTNIGITAAGRAKAEDILDSHPDFFAHVAINFNLSVSGQVNKVLANHRARHPFVKYRTFYNRPKSLQWLMEALPPKPETSSTPQS
jgi:hypothetical protein